ncbi:hypothetical protein SAY86_009660 [Trapa natans]|uniref:Uncharacterized protein n=1 Tax=Trapa natans TaxID=22666 RepID=A0AAN7QT73_TRANT|nr:hypothetical protein SAY86_009660 [Trapa natans]
MADQQRVHPGPDPEAALPQTPSAPLMPRGASKSDKGDPAAYPTPAGYAIAGAAVHPGPKARKKNRNCCCRFLCWTLLILLILTQNGTALLETVQTQLQQTGVVPLNLRVRQPVRIKLGKLKLPKMRFLVRCRLEVNNLSSQNSASLKSSSCKFRFRRLG